MIEQLAQVELCEIYKGRTHRIKYETSSELCDTKVQKSQSKLLLKNKTQSNNMFHSL